MKHTLLLKTTFFCTLAFFSVEAFAKSYDICWSHYTGWEPWGYIKDKKIMDKWNAKYNVVVSITREDDYIESIDKYVQGKYIGCAMTNMDALIIPAAQGIDSTALIIGDFSNGNDGIIAHNLKNIEDIVGKEVTLIKESVSHYLFYRALNIYSINEKEITLLPARSESEIEKLFNDSPNIVAITWNPILSRLNKIKDAKIIFDSSKIPGEIIDLMVVRSDTPTKVRKAILGAWYEVMDLLKNRDPALIKFLAEQSNSSVSEFKEQLKTTRMFYDPQEAAEFIAGFQLKVTMNYIRDFSYKYNLLKRDSGAKNRQLGISFPNQAITTKSSRILRFENKILIEMAKKKSK